MGDHEIKKPPPDDRGRLTPFKVIAFVVALFAFGGLTFAAGRAWRHMTPGAASTR